MRAWDKSEAGRAWKRGYDRRRRARARRDGRCLWCPSRAAEGVSLCARHRAMHADREDARFFARSEAGAR